MTPDIFHPEGMAFRRTTQTRRFWREAAIALLFCFGVLLLQGWMAEREAAEAAKDNEAQALKLLQHCLNGYPLVTKDDLGRVAGAVICSASKEIKL